MGSSQPRWIPGGQIRLGLERCQPCQENMLTSDWQWLASEVHTWEISCDVRWCTSAVVEKGVEFSFFFMGITWYNHGNDLQNSGNPHSNGYTWSKPLPVTGKPGPGWVVLSQVLPEKFVQDIIDYHFSIIFDRPSVSPKPGHPGYWELGHASGHAAQRLHALESHIEGTEVFAVRSLVGPMAWQNPEEITWDRGIGIFTIRGPGWD